MATKKKSAAAKKRSGAAKTNSRRKKKTNRLPVYIISMMMITILLSVMMYIDYGEGGRVNIAIRNACCGLFGVCGYLIPVIAAGMTVYIIKERDIKKFWIKLGLSMFALINVSAICNLLTEETSYSVKDAFLYGYTQVKGGGFLGGSVAIFLSGMVQKIASYIILFITLILLASAISGVPIFMSVFRFGRDSAASLRQRARERQILRDYDEDDDIYEDDIFATESKGASGRNSDILDAANSFAIDTAGKRKKSEKGAPKKKKQVKEKEKAQKEEKEEFSNGIDEIFGNDDSGAIAEDVKEQDTDGAKNAQAAEKKDRKEKKGRLSEKEKEEISEELDRAKDQPAAEYVFPPITLLNMPKEVSGDKREEMRRTAEKLISVLDDFGVKAKLIQVTQGPTVTRYEIQPDTGIKLSKIVGLADDIALNLAVSTVLVAPVPGKAAVGVEIPNNKVTSVSIRELIETSAFMNAKSRLTVALGKDIGGNVVLGDIAKMPHVLIAGATGSGKSVCINSIIMSILFKAKPEEVKLIMVDPKVVELGVYNGIPHLLIPVVTEAKKAAGALNWAVTEMMRRYDLFKETGVRKLETYNKLMESRGEEKLYQLVVIIDELADLMMVAAKEVEDYICRLAQLARAAGIHLIIATQRPSVDVITGLIKANIPSRIAFAVSSQIDSRTILDKGGAEKLLGMGDMLYHPSGARAATRVQGAFVSDAEIEYVLEFIKEHVGETHYSEDLAEEIERRATGENGVTPDVEDDGDPLLHEAIELAVQLGKISTSMVQRRLGVGYSRAGRIIDQMEARGVISGANGSKPRDVLISHADTAVSETEEDDYDE